MSYTIAAPSPNRGQDPTRDTSTRIPWSSCSPAVCGRCPRSHCGRWLPRRSNPVRRWSGRGRPGRTSRRSTPMDRRRGRAPSRRRCTASAARMAGRRTRGPSTRATEHAAALGIRPPRPRCPTSCAVGIPSRVSRLGGVEPAGENLQPRSSSGITRQAGRRTEPADAHRRPSGRPRVRAASKT